ncbi:MAG: hypothetical protein JST92_26400, partial [Deltaproteobacteria bacterium]|nr:hypothetical protein [Deltaproteobacteria bacterium]
VATNETSARALAVHLFGEAGPELEADMIGEVANICMGTIKQSFSREALAFTSGLPEAIESPKFPLYTASCFRQEAFSLVVNGARLAMRIGVSSRRNVLVTLAQLHEGMVLAKDLYNVKGMLLLASGTRLSTTAVERLSLALQPKQMIEVAMGST